MTATRFRLRRPEVHVFVLWSEARRQERQILADIRAHFRVLGTIEVTWTQGQVFAGSLTRMYGESLPPGSDKERHCGAGPFLTVVVEDARPRYRLRRTSRGVRLVNAAVFDARARYREWTGGGYRVHASDSPAEAERNLALIVGAGASEFRRSASAADVRREASDAVGTHGWSTPAELERVMKAYGAQVVATAHDPLGYVVAAPDVWWLEHIVGGREIEPQVREVAVGGEAVRVTITQGAGPRPGVANKLTALLKDLTWVYPRPATTVAVAGVSVATTVLARRVLPASARPESRISILPASLLAYLVLHIGSHTGRTKQFKHEVLDRFGGDVDDAQTWLLGAVSGGAALFVMRWLQRPGRRAGGAPR